MKHTSSSSIAALAAGGLSAALGLLVLVGWHTHTVGLVQIRPTFVPMVYNTALGFVLCGAGILASALGAPRLTRLAGAVVGVLGLLTLVEHLSRVDLGIDQFLFNHYITVRTTQSGRMAINTTINFILSGAALLAGAWMPAARWVQAARGLLGSVVCAFGLIALSGYVNGIEPAYNWSGQTPMAVQTAAGFVLVGVGLMAIDMSGRRRDAGTPGWLPLQVIVGGLAATICLWQAMNVARQTQIRDGLQARADAQADLLGDWVQERSLELNRMAERWAWHVREAGFDPEREIRSLLIHSHEYGAVQWLDAAGRARMTVSAGDAGPARIPDLTALVPVRAALDKARVERRPAASSSFDLGQGNRAFIIAAPLFTGDRPDGDVVGVVRMSAPFGRLPAPALRQYATTLVEDERRIYGPPPAGGMWAQAPVELSGVDWTVRIEPTVAGREAMASSLPEWTLAIGSAVSILLAAAIASAQQARSRIRQARAAEQGLMDALAFNANLLSAAPVGVLTYRLTGECVSCNEAAAAIVGGTVEQLRSQNFRTLESWKKSGLLELAERVMTTRQGQESSVHIVTIFSEDRWLAARMSLFRSRNDELLLLIINDISMRKRAEDAREQLIAILDATPDFVAIGDLEGRLLYLNTSARRILGLDANQSLSGVRMGVGHPEWALRQVLETAIPAAVRDGAWQGISSLLDRQGREIPFSQVVLAHKGPGGQVAFLSTIMRDLGKQRSLEAQLQQSQKLEAIGRLAGGVAHDFNNLLAVITGYSEMMRSQVPEGHPARPRLEEVVKASRRAAELTRQLLAFSRKQVMQPKILDLNSVVRDLQKMLDRVVGEDVDIKVQTAPDLGTIKADPTQVEQVIMNLVVNARDAMPQGGHLTIETANAEIDEAYAASHPPALPGRFVMLRLSDTGAGMDAETQKRIFEPFFTTKPEGQGTGLGLSMVYGIVKQSGGYVWVYSEVGRGTTFKIYLPRVEAARAAEGPVAAVVDDPRGGETVLVVEDMENVRDMIREVLVEHGYTVLSAASADEALALVRDRRGPIHLLLTDVVMPKMGGRDLAKQIVASHPGTRVLYMSGYSYGAVTHGGTIEEGIELLEKPFSPAQLAHAVRKVLDPPKTS